MMGSGGPGNFITRNVFAFNVPNYTNGGGTQKDAQLINFGTNQVSTDPLATFLAAHPEFEVAFAGVTAAEATALQNQMEEARQSIRRTTTDAAGKKRTRDLAESALRREMRNVILFLSCVIKKNDPRWEAFGLNIPAPKWQQPTYGSSCRSSRDGAEVIVLDYATPNVDFAVSVA
jgi:hypothetical protein